MNAAATALLVAVAVAVAPAAAAGAAGEALGILAVAEPPGPDAELVALAGALRERLAARAPGVLSAETLRERMSGSAPPAALGELDRAFSGALAAHAAGEYEESNRTLRGVIDTLEALPEAPAVFAAWTRAMLRLARSEQELGRAVGAQAVLERLLRAAPELRPDPRQYPPSFQALVEQARARLRTLGAHTLTVEAHPEARVFVDGREVGPTPVAVSLAPGRCRVVGLRGGIRSPAVLVDLSEDRTVRLDMSLAEAMRPDAGPGLAVPDAGRAGRAVSAAARLAMDRVVLAAVVRDPDATFLDATLLDVRRGVVERQARVPLAGGAAAVGALDALAAVLLGGEAAPPVLVVQDASLAVTPDAAGRILAGAPQGARGGRGTRAPGWAGIGTGVAALAAGAVAGILASRASASYDEARAMRGGDRVLPPHTVAEYNATLDRGDRQRRLAIGTGVAAATCAATSAALSWWSWKRTGEIGPFRF